jgi:hypothetical protein
MVNNQPSPMSQSITGSDESNVQESICRSESPGQEVQNQGTANASNSKENNKDDGWVAGISFDDVEVVDDKLVALKGETIKKVTVKKLVRFCIQKEITGYKNKNKDQLCDLIVNKKKSRNIVSVIYGNGDGSSDSQEGEKSSKKTNKTKGSAPDAITKETLYYRGLNTYFHEKYCQDVMKLGSQPTAGELDARQFLHKDIFDKLADTYNDGFDEYVGKLALTHAFFPAHGVKSDDPNKFDTITSEDFSNAMDFLNKQYSQCWQTNNQKLGSHEDFEKFVGGRPYVFYYYHWLASVPNLLNLAVAHLPSAITRDSGENNDNKGKKRSSLETQSNAQKLIACALSGFHSKERMNLLQNKVKQTKKMVEIATQKHGFDKDKHDLMMDNLALERDSKILEA